MPRVITANGKVIFVQSCPDKGTVQHKVADVLFRYRNTPHTTTDKTPVQLFLKREPRTHLSLVKPSLQRHVEKKQRVAKLYKDGLNPMRQICDLYQPVRVKNTRGARERWIPGTIVAVKGPETYLVRVPGTSYDGEIAGAHTWEQFQHRRVTHVFNTCRPF